MPYETSKSMMRRNFDRRYATNYFRGEGIDIGCGEDSIANYVEFFPLMNKLHNWDLKDGDGMLLKSIPDDSLDFVHASHSLEHMEDPIVALTNWIRVCKKGGHLVITVPDEDIFEQGNWPSKYSGTDHKTSWTIGKQESWAPHSYSLIKVLYAFLDKVSILKIELLDATYRYHAPALDQTCTPIGECAIEFVLRKKTDKEITDKGLLPAPQMLIYKSNP